MVGHYLPALGSWTLSRRQLLSPFDWWYPKFVRWGWRHLCPGNPEEFIWSPKSAPFSKKAAVVQYPGRARRIYSESQEFHFGPRATHRLLWILCLILDAIALALLGFLQACEWLLPPVLCLDLWTFWVLEKTLLGSQQWSSGLSHSWGMREGNRVGLPL